MTATAIGDELRALEHEGWIALSSGRGQAFFSRILAEDAIMVLPFGVFDRAASIAEIDDGNPWSKFDLSKFRYIELGPNQGVVTYHAKAQHAFTEQPYEAEMSSLYIRRDGGWQLAMHQQTPLVPIINQFGQIGREYWTGV